MTAPTGPPQGSLLTPELAHALVKSFDGLFVAGHRVARRLPAKIVNADPDAALIPPSVKQSPTGKIKRWSGVRDPIGRDHRVAMALHEKLAKVPGAIPVPDEEIVGRLAGFREFAKTGNVVTIRGVPIPAGAEQTAYYVALRYRPLFSPLADPARVYRGDLAYDAANTTDEMQESILLVGTRIHRDHLVHLQRTAPALFVAIWLRRLIAAERLADRTPMKNLPACYGRSRINDPRRCLMIACDTVAEHERAFDLLDALKFHGGVTRRLVRSALKSCSSMTRLHAVADNTHRHVAGAVGHMRTMHPTMNCGGPKTGTRPVFASVKSGFNHSRLYRRQHRRVVWVCGEMPTRYSWASSRRC